MNKIKLSRIIFKGLALTLLLLAINSLGVSAFARKLIEPNGPPDTIKMLQEVCRSYRLAVVSSSYRSEVEPPLVRGGIRPLFQMLICGDDVKNFKPSPEPYLLAAERMAARRPLVIEDSEAGVASGRAAGFEVLQVSRVENVGREVRKYLAGGV